MKKAALRLNELPQAERDFTLVQVLIKHEEIVTLLPDLSIDNLREAWITILTRTKINRHHQVSNMVKHPTQHYKKHRIPSGLSIHNHTMQIWFFLYNRFILECSTAQEINTHCDLN